jgi:CRISPR-associated endonuclease/helicase Cas3
MKGNLRIKGDSAQEAVKRYQLERRRSSDECWDDVIDVLNSPDRNKVLWVCNTVSDAMKLYNRAKTSNMPGKILLYHARFRYCDRVRRQNEVLNSFRLHGPVLVICNQICEMSLNISSDMLVTAHSPLPALIQRLGRLNRFAEKDDPRPCLIYEFSGQPYANEEQILQMKATDQMLETIKGIPICQSDLAKWLNDTDSREEYGVSSALSLGTLNSPVCGHFKIPHPTAVKIG